MICGFEMSDIENNARPSAPLLRRKQAARFLADTWGIPISHQTLAKLAVTGGGPAYRKAGRIPLYDVAELDAWAQRKLGPIRRSTSDRKEPT